MQTSYSSTAPVVTLPDQDRGAFIVRVYQHVMAAAAAFMAFEALLFATGAAEWLGNFFFQGGGGRWLMLLGAIMVGQWFATNAARDLGNPPRQYAALAGTAFLQALIFAPFLDYVYRVLDAGTTVLAAAAITVAGCAALSVVAFVTRRDLSFLRPLIMWGFGLALVAIVGGVIFGFELGIWFSVAMIGLAGGAILFQTQQIIRHYPVNAHVAAAISLFGSMMTMFWYVLRLLIQLTRD